MTWKDPDVSARCQKCGLINWDCWCDTSEEESEMDDLLLIAEKIKILETLLKAGDVQSVSIGLPMIRKELISLSAEVRLKSAE